jgi:hypothetical protein
MYIERSTIVIWLVLEDFWFNECRYLDGSDVRLQDPHREAFWRCVCDRKRSLQCLEGLKEFLEVYAIVVNGVGWGVKMMFAIESWC